MSRKQPKDVRIDSIITAAVEEFLDKGYEGASVNAIAEKAGVSKGGFYHHFPNKEVLLMEANKKLSEPIVTMAEKAYSDQSPVHGLESYIREYMRYWVSRPRELSFFFMSMSKSFESRLLMDYYGEYVEASTQFFVEMFRKASALGELKLTDPEAYGITLMGALDGVLTYAMIHPELDIDILADRVKKIWFDRE